MSYLSMDGVGLYLTIISAALIIRVGLDAIAKAIRERGGTINETRR